MYVASGNALSSFSLGIDNRAFKKEAMTARWKERKKERWNNKNESFFLLFPQHIRNSLTIKNDKKSKGKQEAKWNALMFNFFPIFLDSRVLNAYIYNGLLAPLLA